MMPYIDPRYREGLDDGCAPGSPGELNYALSQIIDEYLGEDPGYIDYNEVVGVLECLKLELYRRVIAPYESQKLIENGDVFRTRLPPKDEDQEENNG